MPDQSQHCPECARLSRELKKTELHVRRDERDGVFTEIVDECTDAFGWDINNADGDSLDADVMRWLINNIGAERERAEKAEAELEATIKQRDHAEESADRLAQDIGRIVGADVGDHSNANDPWENAEGLLDDLGVELEALREQVQWHRDEDFPEPGRYLVNFYLDQGQGHGHYEELLCEHDPEYGKNALLRPDFAGVGAPSIAGWYGPIPTNTGDDDGLERN